MKSNNLFKNSTLILLCLTLVFTACNNNKKEQESLQSAVIMAHDSVMADMNTLMEKKLQLNFILAHLDSLKTKNVSLDTAKVRTDLTQVKTELATADDEMMAWMHNFNPDYTGKSHDEIISYLNDQKEKISSVEKSFKRVIFKSDSVITKYK
ncbi:MAG TPA: hypothetical protein VL125_11865 [Pelobium sp.]|nr:hypothetical protein [Pelobium sp.]